jgi:hypothetical protein
MFIGGEICESLLHELKEIGFKINNANKFIADVLFSTKLNFEELSDDEKVENFKYKSDYFKLLQQARELKFQLKIQENLFEAQFERLFNWTKKRRFAWDYVNVNVYKNCFEDEFKNKSDDNKSLFIQDELNKLEFKLKDGLKFQFSDNKLDFIDINFLNDKIIIEIKEEEERKFRFLKRLEKLHPQLNQIDLFEEVKSTNNKLEYPLNIFKDYKSCQLFKYISTEYNNGKFEKTKYINIYHFLNDRGNILICTQKEYITFIDKEFEISISKITPKTDFKYEDKIEPQLNEIYFMFKKNEYFI